MDLKWPENYQERIETILGTKYQDDGCVYFLDNNVRTLREARDSIARIRLMQKGLRQIKSEINGKIRLIKSQQPRKRRGILPALAYNLSIGSEIGSYRNVVVNIDMLINVCERRKVDLELWIGQQRSKVSNKSVDRTPIPADVQIFVWNRDGGKCVKCGSQESLEFDHIIPLSKGGSNTARNIQLLCETCNRRKSNSIGG